MSFPCMDKDPDVWIDQVAPLLRALRETCQVENPTKFIADVGRNHILSIIDAFLAALPGPLDWRSKAALLKNDEQHNEVERMIRKLIKCSLTIVTRLITPTNAADNDAMRKLFKFDRYVKIIGVCGPENAAALGILLDEFLKNEGDQIVTVFLQSEMRNHWDCQILTAIYKRATGQSMLIDKDVYEWLVQWLLSLSKSVNSVGKFIQSSGNLSWTNWRAVITGLAELLECISVYLNDDVLSSCRVWCSRGDFRNLLEVKHSLLNMLVTYFYAAIQIPNVTLADRCEVIIDLARLPWALTLLSHSPDFDILLEMMLTNSRSKHDEFMADIPRLRNLFVAPLLVNSHSFNCMLSTADIPSKMAENRPSSSVRTGTVVYSLVLAYFSDEITAAERALRNPALLPSYLRILVESNPAVNALRSLKAAKNVFPVLEDQESFDYATFFDLNYLTAPYLENLAKAVGDNKPLSKLQKLMKEKSTSVNIDEEIVVIDKISRRDLRYVRLPRFENLFLKDVYETILIAATPDVKVIKQAGVGSVREEFLYEIPSSEDEEEGAVEEGGKEKPIRIKPLNEPLPQEEEDSEEETDEVSAWPPPPPPATQSTPRNRHHGGRGQANAHPKEPSNAGGNKKPAVDYTGGRDRQVKERHKNRDKQRGADRKARQQGFP